MNKIEQGKCYAMYNSKIYVLVTEVYSQTPVEISLSVSIFHDEYGFLGDVDDYRIEKKYIEHWVPREKVLQ